jgi:hypothetical protein
VADPFPSAVGSQDLQASNRLAPQNGDAADVCMVDGCIRTINKIKINYTCVSLQPDVVGFLLFFLRAPITLEVLVKLTSGYD